MAKALRKLYLWNLFIDKSIDQKKNDLTSFFQTVAKSLKLNQYHPLQNKSYKDLFYGITIDKGIIKGKVLRVRADVWPEVFNEKKGTINKLKLSNDDELIETTHFILKKVKDGQWELLLEYNQYGAKAQDFRELLDHVSIKEMDLFTQVNILPEFDDVNKLIKSLKEIASFQLKIRADNVEGINSKGLTGSLKAAKKVVPAEYIHIGWDLSKQSDSRVKTMINNILGKGLRVEGIEELSVRSHTKTSSRLEKYDLLKGKMKFSVRPNTKSKRVVDSDDMFRLMMNKFKAL